MMEGAKGCACPAWDKYECIRVRYGTARGFDPEDEDLLCSTGEACECFCHEAAEGEEE